jgi:hypothetical protein
MNDVIMIMERRSQVEMRQENRKKSFHTSLNLPNVPGSSARSMVVVEGSSHLT